MGVAGIILAALGLALSIIPAIGWILTTLGLAAGSFLSVLGLLQNRKGSPQYQWAIYGIVANIAAAVIILLWIYVFLEWSSESI